MNTIDGNGRKTVCKGITFDVNSTALTFKDSTAEDLASTFNKLVTAKVDGAYVGWGDSPSFIHFKKACEHIQVIEEITYWCHFNTGEFCRFHCMLLIACGGVDKKDFYTEKLSDEDNEIYLTQYRGMSLQKSKPQQILFRTLQK
jgi:hypothetical protein